MTLRKKLIAGNWKMNKSHGEAVMLARDIVSGAARRPEVEVVICPPFTALAAVAQIVDGSMVRLGAQNMHHESSGAFTGEISPPMLRAFFTTHVIIGHSERRTLFGETDAAVNLKVLSAIKNQLRPILCVGESLAERESGSTLRVVQQQVERGLQGLDRDGASGLVIAYEPVWAIGTGKVATTDQAQEVHAFIRGLLGKLLGEPTGQKIRILYGGSMKPANAPDLLAQKDIDGGLIGGASLDARSFLELVDAAAASS